jgi:hypothetical protein
MLKGCLVLSSMRLGVPFIAPRQLGVVESNLGRQFLSSVVWRTGHCPVWIFFLIWRSRPLAALEPLAHRTVRCTPDSPVNFSRTPLITSREQQVRLSLLGAPDTVRCTQTEQTLAEQSHLFSNLISPVSST